MAEVSNADAVLASTQSEGQIKYIDYVEGGQTSQRAIMSYLPIVVVADIPSGVYKADLRRYTGDDYAPLKLLMFSLYLSIWAKYDKNLPEIVYHVCNMTEMTWDAHVED